MPAAASNSRQASSVVPDGAPAAIRDLSRWALPLAARGSGSEAGATISGLDRNTGYPPGAVSCPAASHSNFDARASRSMSTTPVRRRPSTIQVG